MTKPLVMVVDDSEESRVLQRMILEDAYEVVEAESGEACIEQCDQKIPDLILLDVHMPGMSGYEVCVHLRKHAETATVPVIFVSGLNEPHERLEGYEAGADDYLIKPIDGENLLERVGLQLSKHLEVVEAQNQAKESMNVALEAMTYSSEIGQLIQFVTDSQSAKSMEDLANCVRDAIAEFGLQSCVLINQVELFSGCEKGSFEAKLLAKVRNSGERLINVGVRTIVKSDQICILIKNMPVDDESRYGRIKDHLAVMVSICDGPVLALQAQHDMANQRKDVLEKVILVTEAKLEEFSVKLKTHDGNVRKVMGGMVDEIESILFSLGLDDDQESTLMNLVYHANERLAETQAETQKLEGELSVILEGLYSILESAH